MKKLLLTFLIISILFTGFLTYKVYSGKTNLGATIPQVVALFETSLASKIGTTDTSMTLVTGTDLQGTSLSGTYGFIIDEGTASQEFILCSASGTALTNCTRGVSVNDGKTSVVALEFTHRRGASIKITNYPQLSILSRILNGQESIPNILTYGTYLSPTASGQLAPKGYVDFVGTSGCANNNDTTRGCDQQATIAQINAGVPRIGSTGSWLVVNPSYLASSSYGLNLPTAGQKAALPGSAGTPGGGNLYITQADVSNAGGSGLIIRASGTTIPTGITLDAGQLTTSAGHGTLLVYNGTGFSSLASAGNQVSNFALVASNSATLDMAWEPLVRWQLISSISSVSGGSLSANSSVPIPTGATVAIVQQKCRTNDGSKKFYQEFTLFPTGKTSVDIETYDGSAIDTIAADWGLTKANNIKTVCGGNTNQQLDNQALTVWFYK